MQTFIKLSGDKLLLWSIEKTDHNIITRRHGEYILDSANLQSEVQDYPLTMRNKRLKVDVVFDSYVSKKESSGYKPLPRDMILVIKDSVGVIMNDAGVPMLEKDILKRLDSLLSVVTDEAGELLPMLAQTLSYDKLQKYKDKRYFAEPKIDGVRCTLVLNFDKKICYALSRTGKHYDAMQTAVEQVYEALYLISHIRETNKLILDCEICGDGMPLEEVVSAAKALKPETDKLYFMLYDCLSLGEPMYVRKEFLNSLVSYGVPRTKVLETVEIREPLTKEIVDQYTKTFCMSGYEGTILRDVEGIYEPGKRSPYLIKHKLILEEEYVLADTLVGARPQDVKAVLELETGGTFEASFEGKKDVVVKYSTDKWKEENLGKLVTIKFYGYTKYGVPRNATVRVVRDY